MFDRLKHDHDSHDFLLRFLFILLYLLSLHIHMYVCGLLFLIFLILFAIMTTMDSFFSLSPSDFFQ